MPSSLPRRGFLVLAVACVLSLALAVPSVAGSALPGGSASLAAANSAGLGALSQAWSWLKAIWPDAGCGADPDGKVCGPGTAPVRPQGGCGGDPNGKHCQVAGATVRPMAGCGGDPSGGNCGGTVLRPGTAGRAPRIAAYRQTTRCH